jgi:hypothetical protein
VLGGDGVFDTLDKSARIVRAHTPQVLSIVGISFLVFAVPPNLIFYFVLDQEVGWRVFMFVWSSLSAPFDAHVLSVLYYRLTDPERPVIHEDVARWRSVWEGT